MRLKIAKRDSLDTVVGEIGNEWDCQINISGVDIDAVAIAAAVSQLDIRLHRGEFERSQLMSKKKCRSTNFRLIMLVLKIFGTSLVASATATSATAQEVCSAVTSVGECWTGYRTIVVRMANGDRLWLGNLADDVTKARLGIALTSKTTGEPVCYQRTAPAFICSVDRIQPEWWILGGGIYQ